MSSISTLDSSSFSSRSSFSSSSAGPSTPYLKSNHAAYPSSSSSFISPTLGSGSGSGLTPPGALKEYTESLRRQQTKAMAAALANFPLERPPKTFDPAAADDNPFDLLYSPSPIIRTNSGIIDNFMNKNYTMGGGMKESKMNHGLGLGSGSKKDAKEIMKDEVNNDMSTEIGMGMDIEADVNVQKQKIRPALLNFHKSYSSDMNRGDSMDTMASEASFEAAGGDDYFRMYGSQTKTPPSTSSSSSYTRPINNNNNNRLPQTEITIPIRSSSHNYEYTPFVISESPLEYQPRSSVISSISAISTITTDSTSTITSLTSTSTMSTIMGVGHSALTGKLSRPSLNRPRPRAHPYDNSSSSSRSGSNDGTGIGINGRQRENSGRSVSSLNDEEDNLRNQGRTVSEMMVAMAGLRCQKGRNMRNGG